MDRLWQEKVMGMVMSSVNDIVLIPVVGINLWAVGGGYFRQSIK